MFDSVQHILHGFTAAIDLLTVGILAVGAVKFVVAYATIEVRRLVGRNCVQAVQDARRLLAGYILVALELLIVSDVINSVRNQALESLASLAAIVILRTLMGFFLERELREGQADRPGCT